MLFKRLKSGERPVLIVQAMIRKNTGEYLAIKRAASIEVGSWEFPGGMIEPGETIEKALEREIKEETNLKVEIERFVGWGQGFGLQAENGKIYDRFVMFFECRLIKGRLRLNNETAEHKWTPLDDIMQFSNLSRPVRDFFSKFRIVPQGLLSDNGAIIK